MLEERDYLAILDLLGHVHEARGTDGATRVLMARLPVVVPIDLVSYNDIDLTTEGTTSTHFAPEITSQPAMEHALQEFQAEHPLIRDAAATGDYRPRRMSDFIPLPQLRSLDLWHEVFRPLETNHQLAFAVGASPGRVVAMGLNRWRRDFSDRDLAVACVLSDHLPAAFDHARLRGLLERSRPAVCDALSGRESEVLALVAHGRTNREIGGLLDISPRTVDKHVENLRAKIGARSRTQAASMFLTGSAQTPAAGAGENAGVADAEAVAGGRTSPVIASTRNHSSVSAKGVNSTAKRPPRAPTQPA
jgi:DNA-binding CsgD family transcriptional regulator